MAAASASPTTVASSAYHLPPRKRISPRLQILPSLRQQKRLSLLVRSSGEETVTVVDQEDPQTPMEVRKRPPSLISALNVEKALRGLEEQLDKTSAISSSTSSSHVMTTNAVTTSSAFSVPEAHASTARLASIFGFSRALSSKHRTFSSSVRCALLPHRKLESRRSLSLSIVLIQFFPLHHDAAGASVLDKYVKKKKLDPLEAYIPAVILTEVQIKELGQYLEGDQPKFADCRSLLRSGPASSLRINIRAVAQYASDAGNGKYAFDEVDQCLRALEELDSLLLRASRKDSGSSIEAMKGRVVTALNALNSLLKTVPVEVLDKGKAMADAYMNPSDDAPPQSLDPQLKQLESIL